MPESIIYNRMFQSGYKFASSNEVLTIVEYQPDGLSGSALALRMRNLNGTLMYYHEMSLIDFPIWLKVKSQSNLVRYTLHKLGPRNYLVSLFTFTIAFSVGLLYYLRDKMRMYANSKIVERPQLLEISNQSAALGGDPEILRSCVAPGYENKGKSPD